MPYSGFCTIHKPFEFMVRSKNCLLLGLTVLSLDSGGSIHLLTSSNNWPCLLIWRWHYILMNQRVSAQTRLQQSFPLCQLLNLHLVKLLSIVLEKLNTGFLTSSPLMLSLCITSCFCHMVHLAGHQIVATMWDSYLVKCDGTAHSYS